MLYDLCPAQVHNLIDSHIRIALEELEKCEKESSMSVCEESYRIIAQELLFASELANKLVISEYD